MKHPMSVTSYDIHPFELDKEETNIKLGGVNILAPHPLKAHSDGDVVLHAIVDATLGILALPKKRDIGSLFPDHDSKWKDADSAIFIEETLRLCAMENVQLIHVNVQIACKTPRLSSYKEQMSEKIAQMTKLSLTAINVQATSNNDCGAAGQGEAIEVLASVTALKETDIT